MAQSIWLAYRVGGDHQPPAYACADHLGHVLLLNPGHEYAVVGLADATSRVPSHAQSCATCQDATPAASPSASPPAA